MRKGVGRLIEGVRPKTNSVFSMNDNLEPQNMEKSIIFDLYKKPYRMSNMANFAGISTRLWARSSIIC